MTNNVQQHEVSAAELQQTLDIHAMEVAYEKSFQQPEIVLLDEKVRRLRLQILLLEVENGDIYAQLAIQDQRSDELMLYRNEVETQLEVAADNLQNAQSDMRVKLREIETLKAELGSLRGVTMDSTKMLTEKLTLARELSTLRPEVESLRLHAASQQSLLAEKLSLQRQLSSCQVELEAERRSAQRAMAKESIMQAHDSKFESQLDQLQAEVAKERREREKVERQVQKSSIEWECQRTTFESRLDNLKNKVRIAKDQLREEQTKKQNVTTTTHAAAGSIVPGGVRKTTARNPRKRPAAQMDSETMIGTPGIPLASKKSKRGSTLPGDKSTFSITPFLYRTASVALDSPPSKEPSNNGEEEDLEGADDPQNNMLNLNQPSSVTGTQKIQEVNGANEGAPIGISGPTKRTNSGRTKTGASLNRKKTQTVPSLEQVAEEENGAEIRAVATVQPSLVGDINSDDTAHDIIEVKKRKLKILGGGPGRTLFDDDEREVPKVDQGLPVGLGSLGTLGRVANGGSKLGELARRGRANSEFGAFSPLKRDRKAIFAKT